MALFPNDPCPYGAFFEFLQDSSPQVLWHSRGVDSSAERDLLWHIMSIPQPESICEDMQKPIIVTSSFHSSFYCAFLASVKDIEARGFSRWLCFVFAAECESTVVDAMFLHRSTILDVFDGILSRANAVFASEIGPYMKAIDQILLAKDPSELNYDRLVMKRQVLVEFRGKYSAPDREGVMEGLTEESILRLNENLRPLREMAGIDEHLDRLREVMDGCCCHPLDLCAKALSPRFAFPLPRGSVIWAVPWAILSNVLFCIHSGRTLVLVHSEPNDEFCRLLFQAVRALLIFRWKNDCAAFDSPQPRSILLRHALALVPSADPAELPGFGIWDLETHELTGIACPEQSMLGKRPFEDTTDRGSLVELELVSYLHRVKDTFMRFAGVYLTPMPRMPHELPHLMEMFGLSESDTPVFRFWMLARGNRGSRRPILLDNL